MNKFVTKRSNLVLLDKGNTLVLVNSDTQNDLWEMDITTGEQTNHLLAGEGNITLEEITIMVLNVPHRSNREATHPTDDEVESLKWFVQDLDVNCHLQDGNATSYIY